MRKICKVCAKEKPTKEFHPNKTYKDGFTSKCKACTYEDQKRRREQNPEKRKAWDAKYRTESKSKVRSSSKKYYYKNKAKIAERNMFNQHGLTATDYIAKLEEQSFVCAICLKPETEILRGEIRRLSIDHNHSTGAIRGLLCNSCNWLLGNAKESPAILRSAALYLERYEKGDL